MMPLELTCPAKEDSFLIAAQRLLPTYFKPEGPAYKVELK